MTDVPPNPAMRSLLDRMTKPNETDLHAGQTVLTLGRHQIQKMVDHIGQLVSHLGLRPDVHTSASRNGDVWTFVVDMTPGLRAKP